LRNFAHVFALMTRLRQICCHPELIPDVNWRETLQDPRHISMLLEWNEKQTQTNLVDKMKEMISSGISVDCCVCLSDLKHPVISPCAHIFCRTCIEVALQMTSKPVCPLCNASITRNQLVDASIKRPINDGLFIDKMKDIIVNSSSSKVNFVLKEILRIIRDCPEDKIVVVSQFTSFLSMFQPLLKERNISFARLDGGMSHLKRAESVKTFQSQTKNSPKLLLLSLKAGGVGLNLTAANHLLLLDPAWNPASESQCFDRIHRLGQTKPVFIYKFITKNSVEEKMLDIQKKKEFLISGAFHIPEEEQRRRRVEDIMNIFGM